METTRIDRTVQGSTHAAGRRDALRSLGAAGMALLGTLGVADVSSRGTGKGAEAPLHGEKRSFSGFEFATRVVVSAKSDPLTEATGSLVSATAECGGEGKLARSRLLHLVQIDDSGRGDLPGLRPEPKRPRAS
jgi:hypothetical protein